GQLPQWSPDAARGAEDGDAGSVVERLLQVSPEEGARARVIAPPFKGAPRKSNWMLDGVEVRSP
ncbi:MAG TPA: hypothetical protein PLA92_12705, partial [Fimbriimonadaceae bacterium]|nr:hypothetical protein [Fimbriimonadaceae bacterium]